MTIKKTAVATSLLLAMGLSASSFAGSKTEVVDGDKVTIECITQAEVDLLTDKAKAKLTLPVCEEVEKNEKETMTK